VNVKWLEDLHFFTVDLLLEANRRNTLIAKDFGR